MTDDSKKENLQRWIEFWIAAAPENETDEELGLALQALIVELNKFNLTLNLNQEEEARFFDLAMKRLQTSRVLGPRHSLAEAVLRRLPDDPTGAVRYLSTHIQSTRAQQSKRASAPRPRRYDPITVFINEHLEEYPTATSTEILKSIKASKDFLIDDTEVRDKRTHHTAKLKSFPSRVSVARKRFLKGS